MRFPRQKSSAARSDKAGSVSSPVTPLERLVAVDVARRLLGARSSPALRKVLDLASKEGVDISQTPPIPAHEVLSTWAVRLWNVILTGKRVAGLTHLVRALHEIPSDELIEQINVFAKGQTGIVFFSAESKRLIGAIFSTRSDADDRRSRTNFLAANGQSPTADRPVLNLRFMNTK
jgi:hypothetical protein